MAEKFSAADLKKFEETNGMPLEKAWAKVREWNLAGKNDEAAAGCREILKIFPEHPAGELLKKLKSRQKVDRLAQIEQFGENLATAATGKLEKITGKKFEKSNGFDEKIRQAKEFATTGDERFFAALSYAWILVLIPLFFWRESVFVQLHARQGLVLFVFFYFFHWVFLSVLSLLLGSHVLNFLSTFFQIFFFAFCALKAYSGKWWKIPGIYPLAQKFNF
jgi:uncharacterized membrane protein